MIPSLRLIDRNNVHTFVSLCIVLHWSIQPMVKNVIQGQWKSSLNKRVIMLEHVRATKSTTFRNQWNAIKGYLSAKRPQLSNKWILHLKLQNQTRMESHLERWLMDRCSITFSSVMLFVLYVQCRLCGHLQNDCQRFNSNRHSNKKQNEILTSLNWTRPRCPSSLMQLWADSVWKNSCARHISSLRKDEVILKSVRF